MTLQLSGNVDYSKPSARSIGPAFSGGRAFRAQRTLVIPNSVAGQLGTTSHGVLYLAARGATGVL